MAASFILPLADVPLARLHVSYWGVKRTWLSHRKMSANDPKRTLFASAIGPFQSATLSCYDELSSSELRGRQ